MAIPDMIKELLENGVHFGHLSKHWNPKMKKFIFGKKKNVYIIDLEKTAQKIDEAKEFAKTTTQNGGKILFVATKRQLRDLIKELASSCGMPYVTERWVGGFLTNFSTVKERINKYTALLKKREEGGFDKISRKEVVRINRDLERMEKNYSGVASLDTIPDVIFLVDPKKETACVREANILSVPIIALVDTDADPEVIDYPIPGNDDAIKSVRYIASCIVEAIKDGSKHADKIAREKKEQAESIGDAIEVDEQDLEEKITGKEEETPKRRTQRKGVK